MMAFGLINMNGRVYDPMTSSFLSVDNYVQDPSSTQNFNRYAYCMNNPLKYTDPDGEWAHLVIGALIGGIVNLATNWSKCDGFWEYAAAFGAGAANGALSAAAPGWGSLLGGALSGATNNLISQTGHNFSSTGSFDSSSFWTSVASGAAAGVGGYLGSSVGSLSVGAMNITSPALKSLVGGTVGGASGGFLGGFAGGALSKDSDITSALEAGLSGAISGVAIGGVSGVANGIVDSRANNVNFWTGKAGVEKASQELIAEGYTLHSTEITVEVNGVRVRLDIAMFKDGNVYLVEVKNGPHAGFTPNQKAAYPQMTDSPNILKAPIIPKGSNAIPVFGAPNIGQPTTNYNLMIIHYY
jgi:RHS repeat-associated protein